MPLGIDIQQILLHLLNFTILFAGLYILLYSPVKKFLEEREKHYKDIDEQSRQKMTEAEEAEKKYSEQLKGVEDEIKNMKKTASSEINAMRLNAEEEAKNEASKILESARKAAELEKKEIIDSAKGEITKLVEEAAHKMILDSDSDELYDRFLNDAERSLNNGAGVK